MIRKLLIILAFVILGISGCEKNVIDNEKKTSVKNEPVLSNINYYDDKIENEYGDITLFASIKNKNEGYEHVAWTNFLGVNGNKAIIYHNEENGKRYVLRINTDTKAVEETMGLTEDDYAMCINDYILIKHEKYEKNEFNYVLYDYDFNEICRLDVDSSYNGIFLDKNMEKLSKALSDLYDAGDLDVKGIITYVLLNGIDDDAQYEKLTATFTKEQKKIANASRNLRGKKMKPEKPKKPKKYIADRLQSMNNVKR